MTAAESSFQQQIHAVQQPSPAGCSPGRQVSRAGCRRAEARANPGWRTQVNSQRDPAGQSAYALLKLTARYDFNDNLYASLNINNVTDKRYLTSLHWADQGYYGAPRNASMSLTWKY